MTTTPTELEGGCQCRAVRYRVTGEPIAAALCHCSMCRRANAAPAVAWALFSRPQVDYLNLHPSLYESSPGCLRGFCPRCGTQISHADESLPGLVDLTIGSLDNPDAVTPRFHCWHGQRVGWGEWADTLPRYARYAPVEAF